jgi:hypothetical protein
LGSTSRSGCFLSRVAWVALAPGWPANNRIEDMNGKADMKKAVAVIVAVIVLSLAEIATARHTQVQVSGCDVRWYTAIVDFATGEAPSGLCDDAK